MERSGFATSVPSCRPITLLLCVFAFKKRNHSVKHCELPKNSVLKEKKLREIATYNCRFQPHSKENCLISDNLYAKVLRE